MMVAVQRDQECVFSLSETCTATERFAMEQRHDVSMPIYRMRGSLGNSLRPSHIVRLDTIALLDCIRGAVEGDYCQSLLVSNRAAIETVVRRQTTLSYCGSGGNGAREGDIEPHCWLGRDSARDTILYLS